MFINSMSDLVNYLSEVNDHNDVNGTMRDIDISAFWIMARVEAFGGSIVLQTTDCYGDSMVLFSLDKHFPDTKDQNAYCVAHVTADGFLASFEKGSFQECFDCLVEWVRTEIADIA